MSDEMWGYMYMALLLVFVSAVCGITGWAVGWSGGRKLRTEQEREALEAVSERLQSRPIIRNGVSRQQLLFMIREILPIVHEEMQVGDKMVDLSHYESILAAGGRIDDEEVNLLLNMYLMIMPMDGEG
mgnify:CR=1 FL=1